MKKKMITFELETKFNDVGLAIGLTTECFVLVFIFWFLKIDWSKNEEN